MAASNVPSSLIPAGQNPAVYSDAITRQYETAHPMGSSGQTPAPVSSVSTNPAPITPQATNPLSNLGTSNPPASQPATAPTPTSTPPPVGSTGTTPVYTAGTSGSIQSSNPQENAILNPTDPTNQADAYSKLLSQSQSEISQIEQSFQPLFAQADIHGQQRQGSVDALVAAGMIAGASGKTAATAGATAATNQERAQIQSQMEQQVASVYAQVQQNSISLANIGQQEAQNATAFIQQIKANAIKNLDSMASIGVSAQSIQASDPQLYDQMKIQSGMTDYQMSSYLLSKMPAQYQPYIIQTYAPSADGKGTTITRTMVNPSTGQQSVESYQIAAPYAQVDSNAYKQVGSDLYYQDPKSGNLILQNPFKTIAPGYGTYNTQTGQPTDTTGGETTTSGVNPAAQGVATLLGVSTDAQLSQLEPAQLAQAIASQEGFTNGTSSIAIANNNPGNLKFDNQPGATKGGVAPDGGNYAKFGNLSDGWKALNNDIIAKMSSGKFSTLNDLMNVYSPISGQPSDQSSQSLQGMMSSLSPQGQANFNKLNSTDQSTVSQLINGDVLLSDIMSSRGVAGSIMRQDLLKKVQSVSPSFSENQNKQRYTFKTQWNDPQEKAYITRNSINTAMGHASDLLSTASQMTKLDAGVLTMTGNDILNFFSKNSGQGPVIQFNYIRDQLASEIATVYKGGVPDQQEVDRNTKTLNAALSGGGIKELINTAVSLLNSKIQSTASEYKNTMGQYPTNPIVSDATLQSLQQSGADISPIVSTELKQGYEQPLQDAAKIAGYSTSQLTEAINQYGFDSVKQALGIQ